MVWDSMTEIAATRAEEKSMATSLYVSWTTMARVSECEAWLPLYMYPGLQWQG